MWTVLLSLVAVQAYQEKHQAILSLGDRPAKAGFHYSKTVEVHLTGQPQYAADDPINVNVELYNPGPGAVKILSYFLPAAGSVLDKLFEVTLDGAEVDYIGPTGMRSTPTDADYIKLKKKQSASASFDLAEYFDFSRTGTYTITYDVASWQLFDESGATQKIEGIASDPLVASIEGRPPSPDALGVPDEKKSEASS
jgi:peptidyl-Lys metalloendopeptidase